MGPHIHWIDNFSKLYNRTKPSIESGPVHNSLWTGVAVIEWDGASDVSLELVRHQDGSNMAALPPRLCTGYFDRGICQGLSDIDALGMNVLDMSTCTRYNVNNVPCKPVVDITDDPALHALLEQRGDGMRNLYPQCLIKANIGKNTDLLKIMRQRLDEVEAARPQRYGVVLADIDIFSRCLKVIHMYIHVRRIIVFLVL
jgi:hypothetical protein